MPLLTGALSFSHKAVQEYACFGWFTSLVNEVIFHLLITVLNSKEMKVYHWLIEPLQTLHDQRFKHINLQYTIEYNWALNL